MGGWVKPQLEFFFFLEIVCLFVVFVVYVSKKKWIGGGWYRFCGQSDFFPDFFIFFNLTRPLYNRLSFKNDVCNDNDPFQAGFRSSSRTTDNIFVLCAIIYKQRYFSKPLYTCSVNFTKTFNYIDRSALYYKLLSRGIDGFFFKCNKEYVL